MRGYTQLADEVVRQWKTGPTHVFVQAGVGGLAAAVIGHLWAVLAHRPIFVVVEPQSADCWFQSNRAGKPALASGNAETAMGGLACREISPITWPILGLGADWFMTIEEDQVTPARRLFAHPAQRRQCDFTRMSPEHLRHRRTLDAPRCDEPREDRCFEDPQPHVKTDTDEGKAQDERNAPAPDEELIA